MSNLLPSQPPPPPLSGATALSIITFSIMTLCIATLSIAIKNRTLIIMAVDIVILSAFMRVSFVLSVANKPIVVTVVA
jgi:hypothetical protein